MAPPNIRFINQSAPFWDWIASFEEQASEHPFFNDQNGQHGEHGERGHGPWQGRGHWHGRVPHHAGPPPPHHAEASSAQNQQPTEGNEKARESEDNVPDPPEDAPHHPPPPGAGCGRRGRGCGPRRGGHRSWHGGPHPYARHGWPLNNAGGFGFLSDLFGGVPEAERATNEDGAGDFKPEADVFDTKASYVVHLSLPGAHKEDIGVSWDPEKSELTISGVVHRPGDEEFLKALAMDERKVGAFERKVRLGTRASPSQVDIEGITAKLENGILIVEVPKLHADFVEIRKVDIE